VRDAFIRTQDGLTLRVREWRGGRRRLPILCLPGFARTAMDFDDVAAAHGADRQVIALDYPGRGDSERPERTDRYAPEAMLRDVLDACAAFGMHHAVVIGTSFGGILAMAIGAARPTLLRAVVLNDIGPDLPTGGIGRIQGMLGTEHAFPDLPAAESWLRQHLVLDLDDAGWRRAADSTFVLRDGAFRPRWDTRIATLLGGPRRDIWPLFGALAHVPVLAIRGERSDVLGAETLARMRAARPDLRTAEVPRTGHAPTLTEPAAVAALSDFLP
jgi:pimeloyl-ACP methyl ester carboxylesterase